MFGLNSIPFDREFPHSPEECLRRLEKTADDQFRVKSPEEIRNHEGLVRMGADGFRVRLESRASVEGGTPLNLLEFEIRPQDAGARLVGQYRLGTGSRASMALLLGIILCAGIAGTGFLLWAAAFGAWREGGEYRFLFPLIPLVGTAGVLSILHHVARIDRSRIDAFLDRAFDPGNEA